MSGKVLIGTSGWHYKHWRGLFYPADLPTNAWLKFYSQHFKTVELNNSFYRLPTPAAFDIWREVSPRGFVFAVKGSRFTTHMKKLKDPKPSTDKFFDAAVHLRSKLGPILFQLPPHWKADKERLEEFLKAMPKAYRYAFEFRDESWLVPEVFSLLRRYKVAHCLHDFADMKVPLEVTTSFSYIRFHGPTSAKYFGSYSAAQLREWAKRIADWSSSLSAIYVYFNNDPGGEAVKNALELKRLVSGLL